MKRILKKLIKPTGYTFIKLNAPVNPQLQNTVTSEQWFDLFFSRAKNKDFFFIQIGANDGSQGDFLHKYIDAYNLRGLLVEPQTDVFEKLKKTYQEYEKLTFANVAISEETGVMPFYTVKKELHTDENYFDVTAISTFDKETFKKTVMKRVPHKIEDRGANIDAYADVTNIQAISFDELLKKYEVDHIDYLQTDCEGYDYEIIKTIDFKTVAPRAINFESKWLSDEDRMSCEKLLKDNGYSIFRHGNDTCAFLV